MIVLDSSAAMGMVRETDEGLAFRSLIYEGEKTIAPELFKAELGNSIWKYLRSGRIEADKASEWLDKGIGLVDEFVPTSDNLGEALFEAARLDHPVYDLLYLTIARRNAATLVTCDKRLNALCDELGVNRIHEVEL